MTDFWTKFSTGANAPPELAWQEGKTAASIQWVAYLEESDISTSPLVVAIVQSIKAGEIVASRFPPPSEKSL